MKAVMPTAGVPLQGLWVTMPEKTPVQRLVDAVAAYLHLRADAVRLSWEGQDLQREGTLRDSGVTLPGSRQRTREIPLWLSVEAAPAAARPPSSGPAVEASPREEAIEEQPQELDNCTNFTLAFSEDWPDALEVQLKKLTAVTNTTKEELLMTDAELTSASGQKLDFDALCEREGAELRACFPLRVQFGPRLKGERVEAPLEVRDHIERVMNSIAGFRRFRVAKVFINRNDGVWRRYVRYQEALRRQVGGGLHGGAREPETVRFHQACFGQLDRDLNECMLFHGTSLQSATAILGQSFSLEFAQAGAFGPGIYFAENPVKSDGYSRGDDRGLKAMLLCRVTCGRTMVARRTGDYRQDVLGDAAQADCIEGACFQFREFIIFREEQCYPEYIILYQ